MEIADQLAARFACPRCKTTGAAWKRIAATGTGLTRIFNWQLNKFIVLTCKNCGYSELYDSAVLEERSRTGDILDIIFGS